MKNINILVLGPPGVGKSTWINSTAAFLQSSTFKHALKNKSKITFPVPCYCRRTENNHEMTIKKINPEMVEVGPCITHETSSYYFTYKDNEMCFIDTPGIGDVDGWEEDKKKIQNVVEFLTKVPIIHGICVLIRLDKPKLYLNFKQCVQEISLRLPKESEKKTIFCFTQTDQTENTLELLQRILNEMRFNLKLNSDTIYYLDNEGFKHIVRHDRIEYTVDEERDLDDKWNRSYSETIRLFDYLIKEADLSEEFLKGFNPLDEKERLLKPTIETRELKNTKSRPDLQYMKCEDVALQLNSRNVKDLCESPHQLRKTNRHEETSFIHSADTQPTSKLTHEDHARNEQYKVAIKRNVRKFRIAVLLFFLCLFLIVFIFLILLLIYVQLCNELIFSKLENQT